MPWKVSAKPKRHKEAVDYFRERVPMTDKEYAAADERTRARAFWFAGGAEAHAVQTVFDEIATAIAKGTTVDDFKRAIRTKLGDQLGAGGYHLDTVFRNATQWAYNTERWHQLQDPKLVKARPYLLIDAIIDARTTQLCRRLNGTVKAASDPYWRKRWPPYHHDCRTGIRSLTRREAEKRGVTTDSPDVKVDDGFGLAPSDPKAREIPKPDKAKMDKRVRDVYEKREKKLKQELADAQKKAREERRKRR